MNDAPSANGHAPSVSVQEQLAQVRAELELEQARTEILRLQSERRVLEEHSRWLGPRSEEVPDDGPKKRAPRARDFAEAIFIGTHKSLTEAYSDYASYTGTGWGALVDPLDAYTDVDGFLLPSAGIADRRSNATSLLTPLIRNELQLLMVRGAARLLLDMNPFAIGVLENLTAFVVGEGMPCRAVWRAGQEQKGDDLPARIQATIDHFYEAFAYDEFQQELIWRSSRDGEYFLCYEEEQLHSGLYTGEIDMQVLEPEFITQEGAPSDFDPKTGFDAWSWGIHTPHRRPSKALDYNVKRWSAAANEVVPALRIDHTKVNVDRNLKRGIPDFAPVADGMEGARKLVRNTREGAAVQAAIAGIWEYDGTPMAQVQGQITQNRDAYRAYNPSPVTGKQINYQKIEPGTFVHAPKSKQFKPLLQGQSNTPGFIAAVQMALRGVAVRWGLPEYIVSADATNQNFASILVAGSPFVRQIQRRQKFHKRRFLLTLWRVIHCAWRAKRYGDVPWNYIQKAIELQMEPPTPQIADRMQEAQASEIEHRNGVLSTQTWRARRGYDNDLERKNLAEEPPPQSASAAPKGDDAESPLSGLLRDDPRGAARPEREARAPASDADSYFLMPARRAREVTDAQGHKHDAKGQFSASDAGKSVRTVHAAQPAIKNRVPEQQPNEKAQRAKAAHKLVDKDIQRYAEEHNEPRFAKVVQGYSLPDGEPVDVVTKRGEGVELKTLVDNSNGKLTMDTYSQVRKILWEQENDKIFHTVVSDDQAVFNANGPGRHDDSKRKYYYRRGVAGSARISSMYECKDETELKRLMAMPEEKLPPAAQRSDGKLRQGRWEFFQDEQGKGYRNTETGQITRAKK